MKTKGIITIMLCLIGFNLMAQEQSEKQRKERFETWQAERIEFISNAVDLTADEAKVFWPVANELQAKKWELNKTLREEMRKIRIAKRNDEMVSDADYKKLVELSLEIKIKEAQLEQEYVAKMLKVVSAEKVYLYQQADLKFAAQTSMMRKNQEHNNKGGAFAPKKR